MDKATYQKYVERDCWALRRSEYLRKQHSCEACGQNLPLQVHHLSYENLGHEPDRELIAVCDGCHKMFHRLHGGTPKEWVIQRLRYLPEGPRKDLIFKWLAA